MKRENRIPKKFFGVSYKLSFLMIGILSTIWFLIRVIPKPTRATYPCMRAAAPIMSSFIIYVIGISTSMISFRKFRHQIRKSRYLSSAFFLTLSLAAFGLIFLHDQKDAIADVLNPVDNTFPVLSNQPVGEAQGMFPGRVVWVLDRDATNENYVPEKYSSDFWYSDNNANETVINNMLRQSITSYAGKEDLTEAWDAIFKSFNESKGKGAVGYTPGEKIAFKINLTNQACSDNERPQRMDATPQLLNAILGQLTTIVGVAQEDITLGDPYREFRDEYKIGVKSKYPNVYYVDGSGGDGIHQTVPSEEAVLVFSDGLYTSTLPQQYLDAEYVINLPCLKTHNAGGITVIAKNHQGSYLEKGDDPKSQYAEKIHYSLPGMSSGTGKYRHLVDFIGHEQTGGKALLYIIDGIWGGEDWSGWIKKFQSAPFNDDYPNSILVGQDPVALESVCFDILFNENVTDDSWKDFPIDLKFEVADYLSQCASSDYWPEGIQYDPEGDGTPIASLGVFEHWNNAIDRQYSRNLGTGNGIELLTPIVSQYDPCDLSNTLISYHVVDASCPGAADGSIVLDISGTAEPYLITWYNNSSSDTLSGLRAACYRVFVKDDIGCTQSKEICISEPERMILGDIIGENNVEATQKYTYSVSLVESSEYHWMVSGGSVKAGQGSHMVEIQWGSGVSGEVSVYAESALGCLSDTSRLEASIHSTNIENSENSGISIYPNPTTDKLIIEVDNPGHYSLSLWSLNGKLLLESKSEQNASQLDLSKIPKGVYYLRIKSDNFTVAEKIVKM